MRLLATRENETMGTCVNQQSLALLKERVAKGKMCAMKNAVWFQYCRRVSV